MTEMKTALAALEKLIARRNKALQKMDKEELELIEAARAAGASWSKIAPIIGKKNKQSAEQRHKRLIEITGGANKQEKNSAELNG